MLLHMAKTAAKLFIQWRLAFMKKRLTALARTLTALQRICQGHPLQLESLGLLQRSYSAWRRVETRQMHKAANFCSTQSLVRLYQLFRAWRGSSWNLRVAENHQVLRQRRRVLFTGWLRSMSSYLHMKDKAKSYRDQALSSKALLTLYIHASKMNRLRDFQRRIAFRKYFKRIWKSRFTRQRTLKVIVKSISKKEAEWERTRYQREFNYLMQAFEVWKARVDEKRELIHNYNALSQYRSTLLIKCFSCWKGQVRVKRGTRILQRLLAITGYYPAMGQLRAYTLKNELMHRNWLGYRQNYLKQQVIVRIRELVIKKKLATMFFKKRLLLKLKHYVFKKNKSIPYQFWCRYR